MANLAKEPWMDPLKNAVTEAMEGTTVKPVMMIDPATGDPVAGGGGGGGATAANQEKEIWDRIVGNSIEFTYYTTIVANNPSGNKNVATAVYKDGGVTQFTQTFAYDASDDVLSITTT